MENHGVCKNCRSREIILDDDSGHSVCSACGVVQDYNNFEAQLGGINGPTGSYVRVGTAGTGGSQNYKEHKTYEAQKLIRDFTYKLGLCDSKARDIEHLVQKVTDGEYGSGNWFPVFVGACSYVIMRKEGKRMLPIVQVADLVGCDEYELGHMIRRVVDFVDMQLPEFDIVNSFEHAVRNSPCFVEVEDDKIRVMLKQGVFLVQCMIKWCLTTGRRPIPVVAAVLVFVCELNQVVVSMDDVCNELHVVVITCKRRYKELLEMLVKVAVKVLPWGKDVTVKNILKNAPFVIQYMEMKSMSGKKKNFEFDIDIEGLLENCLSKDIGYSSYIGDAADSRYFEPKSSGEGFPENFQVSPESLIMMYNKFLDDIALVKAEAGIGNKRKRRGNFDYSECVDWWKGKSDLSKKLMLKQILKKDVGFDANPPSFDRVCLVKQNRREKIKTAKLRIQKIMHPTIEHTCYRNEIYVSEPKKSRKRKNMEMGTDWEDLIIETLLLHNVKEDEIEKGHYDVLMALHVFNDRGTE